MAEQYNVDLNENNGMDNEPKHVPIPAGAKVISQETFDAAVQENIEEFDMEEIEAIEDAVKQFTEQVALAHQCKSSQLLDRAFFWPTL